MHPQNGKRPILIKFCGQSRLCSKTPWYMVRMWYLRNRDNTLAVLKGTFDAKLLTTSPLPTHEHVTSTRESSIMFDPWENTSSSAWSFWREMVHIVNRSYTCLGSPPMTWLSSSDSWCWICVSRRPYLLTTLVMLLTQDYIDSWQILAGFRELFTLTFSYGLYV